MLKSLKDSISILSWITMPPTKPPRSRRGSPADRIIRCTSPRLRRRGSIRARAGSLSSRESGSSAVFIPPSGNSKPISELSSIGTLHIPQMRDARARAEVQRVQEVSEENKLYCEKWGMPARSHEHLICTMDLDHIRKEIEESAAAETAF